MLIEFTNFTTIKLLSKKKRLKMKSRSDIDYYTEYLFDISTTCCKIVQQNEIIKFNLRVRISTLSNNYENSCETVQNRIPRIYYSTAVNNDMLLVREFISCEIGDKFKRENR